MFGATTVLGRRSDDGVSDLCARQLQERIVASGSRKPVLLAVSLKHNTADVLRAVLDVLDGDDIKLW